jgi:hypothetical protein
VIIQILQILNECNQASPLGVELGSRTGPLRPGAQPKICRHMCADLHSVASIQLPAFRVHDSMCTSAVLPQLHSWFFVCKRLPCVSVVFATPVRLCECEWPPADGIQFCVRLQFAVALPPLFGFHSGYFVTAVHLISRRYLAAVSGRCFHALSCRLLWPMLCRRGHFDPFFGGTLPPILLARLVATLILLHRWLPLCCSLSIVGLLG